MGFFLEEEIGSVRRIQQEEEPLLLALRVGRAHGKKCRQPLKTEQTRADSQQGPHSLLRAQTPGVPASQPHRNCEQIRGCCLQLVSWWLPGAGGTEGCMGRAQKIFMTMKVLSMLL